MIWISYHTYQSYSKILRTLHDPHKTQHVSRSRPNLSQRPGCIKLLSSSFDKAASSSAPETNTDSPPVAADSRHCRVQNLNKKTSEKNGARWGWKYKHWNLKVETWAWHVTISFNIFFYSIPSFSICPSPFIYIYIIYVCIYIYICVCIYIYI